LIGIFSKESSQEVQLVLMDVFGGGVQVLMVNSGFGQNFTHCGLVVLDGAAEEGMAGGGRAAVLVQ
jgi:hypothetical protein